MPVTPPIPTIAPAGTLPGVQAPAGDPRAFMAALAAAGTTAKPTGTEANMGSVGQMPVQGMTGGDPAPVPRPDAAAPGQLVQPTPMALVADSPAPPLLTPAVPAPFEPFPAGEPVAEQAASAPVPQGAPPAPPRSSPPAPAASQLSGEPRTTGAAALHTAVAATPPDMPVPPTDDAPEGVSAAVLAAPPQEPKAKAAAEQPAGQAAGQSSPAASDAPAPAAPPAPPLQGEPASALPEAVAIPILSASPPAASAARPQTALGTVDEDGQAVGRVPRRKAASAAVPSNADAVAQEGGAVQALPIAPPVGTSHLALPGPVAPKQAERVLTSNTGHVAGDVAALSPSSPDLAPPAPSASEPRVPAPLFTQTLDIAAARHAALPYDIAPTGPAADGQDAVVSMRQGSFGADVGVAIARALDSGPDGVRDALLIRLDPRHMGRIDVKMSFDDDGTLRAVVSADQPAALDMLRRESTHLDRALADAGVRADAQSLRFDGSGSLGSGAGGQQRHGGRPQMPAPQPGAGEFSGTPDGAQPILRSLRGSGHVDLMA